jgi:adenosine deaminase
MIGNFRISWFERVPKVELHLHLEGAIPHPTLWQLIQKYGGDPSVPNPEALHKRFQYRDFKHFLEMWVWKNQFIREYDDYTLVAEAVARDLAGQNIRYAEVFYSPSRFFAYGLKTQEMTKAIRRGLDRVPEIKTALITDLVRDNGVGNAMQVLSEINEMRPEGVIGITIGGSENDFPPQLFTEVFRKAQQLGFHTTAHAGEAAGPESILSALRDLKVERIGHGTRAVEDERLMEYLANNKIPLEVCPLSNVRTGVVPSIEAHPVRKFFERGLLVTINTDDPRMFGNSLAEEYQLLVEKLGFSLDEIRTLILQGVQSSWLDENEKQRFVNDFRRDPNWNS